MDHKDLEDEINEMDKEPFKLLGWSVDNLWKIMGCIWVVIYLIPAIWGLS